MLVYLETNSSKAYEDGDKLGLAGLTLSAFITAGTTVYLIVNYRGAVACASVRRLATYTQSPSRSSLVILYLSYRAYGITFGRNRGRDPLRTLREPRAGNSAPRGIQHRTDDEHHGARLPGVHGSISRIIATWVALFCYTQG